MISKDAIIGATIVFVFMTPFILIYTHFMSRHFPIFSDVEDEETVRRERGKFVRRFLLCMEAFLIMLILLIG